MVLATLQTILIYAIPILFAITVHEVAHGWVASRLGDQTARMLGRLTLNPLKHIDLVGTILIPALLILLKTGFIFGWAKPVPITWKNLRHPRRDAALIACAGPAVNLVMALLWGLLCKLGYVTGAQALIAMGQVGIFINLILMVLNLIPIPPLDGSRVVSSLLPPRIAAKYDRIGMFGFLILLALLYLGILNLILVPIVTTLVTIITTLFGI